MSAIHLDFDRVQGKAFKLIRSGENPTAGLMIVVGINVGLRVADLMKLTFGDLRKDKIQLKEGKTGKTRTISMNENIKHAMQYFDNKEVAHKDEFLAFRSQKGTTYSNKHVNRLLKKYFGEDNVSSHTLRKTFGRRVYNSLGQTEHALMYLSKIFNHTSISVTREYLGIQDQEIEDIYLNL
jgi:integrase